MSLFAVLLLGPPSSTRREPAAECYSAVPADRPSPVADIPFQHAPGRIWIQGTLNGKPARTMLDSGAGGIVVFEEAAKRAGGVKGDPFQVGTIGGPSDAWQASGLSFGIEGTTVSVPVPVIVSLARAASRIDEPEVAAGFGLFGAYAIEIDYANAKVRLFRSYDYLPIPGAVALRLLPGGTQPCVRMKLQMPGGKAREVRAQVDTGSPAGIEVSRRLAKSDGMDARYKAIAITEGNGGIGGRSFVRNVPGIVADFGGFKVDGTAVVHLGESGANGAQATWDVVVGDDLLRHFDLAFDYAHQTLWAKPNGQ